MIAKLFVSLLPVLIAVKIAKDKRNNCHWPVDEANNKIIAAVLILILSQLIIFTPAQPFSLLSIVCFALEVCGVYMLARAIYRKKDLANVPATSTAENE